MIEMDADDRNLANVQGGFYCIWNPRQPGAINYNPMFEGSYFEFRDVPECANYVVRFCD